MKANLTQGHVYCAGCDLSIFESMFVIGKLEDFGFADVAKLQGPCILPDGGQGWTWIQGRWTKPNQEVDLPAQVKRYVDLSLPIGPGNPLDWQPGEHYPGQDPPSGQPPPKQPPPKQPPPPPGGNVITPPTLDKPPETSKAWIGWVLLGGFAIVAIGAGIYLATRPDTVPNPSPPPSPKQLTKKQRIVARRARR